MKQKIYQLTLLTVITIFIGCSPIVLPLKGAYGDKPFALTSDKSVDTVWSNIIDLFATKGLSIKVIDKNSGLIVSEKTSLMNNYTFEDATGKLKNPDAWVVLNSITWMDTEVLPERLTGEWNVRIKAAAAGKTTINVNLTNIEAVHHYAAGKYTSEQNFVFDARSTGKFEQTIAELVK